MKLLFCTGYHWVRKLSTINLFTIFILSIVIVGCSTAPTFMRSDFDQKQIKLIAIMPVIDKRIAIEDTVETQKSLTKIEELLSQKIIDKHYDVLTAGTVKNTIKGNIARNMSPENLCTKLKVDGIIISELYDFTDVFFINHSIKMSIKIYDAQGDSLWINDLDDSDRPFLSAIGASLGWAIGVAVDNKIDSKDKAPIMLAGVAAAEIVYPVSYTHLTLPTSDLV